MSPNWLVVYAISEENPTFNVPLSNVNMSGSVGSLSFKTITSVNWYVE